MVISVKKAAWCFYFLAVLIAIAGFEQWSDSSILLASMLSASVCLFIGLVCSLAGPDAELQAVRALRKDVAPDARVRRYSPTAWKIFVWFVAGLTGLVALLALFVFGALVVRKFAPETPLWADYAVLAVAAWVLAIVRMRRRSTASVAETLWRIVWPSGAVLLVGHYGHRIDLSLIAAIILVMFIEFFWLPRQHALISIRAFKKGDYPMAVLYANKAASRSLRYSRLLRAAALFHSGRLEEAATTLRPVAHSSRRIREVALAYEALGEVELTRGNHDEAEAALDAAIRAWPDRGAPYRHLALSRLLKNDLVGAESLIRRALEFDSGRPRDRAHDSAIFARVLGSRRRPESDVTIAIGAATAHLDALPRPEQAEIRYHAACACLALGAAKEARKHFGEAQDLDPNGYYGRRSAQLSPP